MRKKFVNIIAGKIRSGDVSWFFRTAWRFSAVVSSAYTGKVITGPLNVIVAPSWRCNSRCSMCDFHSREHQDLTTVEMKRIIEETAAMGCSVFSFFGGEPLLRPDLIELIQCLKKKGIITQVSTNGILLANEGIARKLIEADVDIITLSIDCMDPKSYKRIRGVDKYADVIKGVRNIVRYRAELGKSTKINANMVLLDENIDRTMEIVRSIQQLGVDVVTPYPVHELQSLTNTQSKDFAKKVVKLYTQILSSKERFSDLSDDYMRFVIKKLSGKPVPRVRCMAPLTDLHVDPLGNVYPCIYLMGMKQPIGNIKGRSIRDFWYSKEYAKVRAELKECRKCYAMCHLEPALVFNKFTLRMPRRER